MKALQTAVAIALLMPALAMAQKVSFDFDKTEDFSRIKSYTLKDGTKVNDPLVHNRIIAAMESELAAKGLSKNDATPDAVVVYHIAFDKKQDITTFSSGWRLRPVRLRVGRRLGARPMCASTKSSSGRWSSTSLTRPRSRSCGAAWASRKWTSRRRPKSATRTSRRR